MAENQVNFEEVRQAWISCTEAEGRAWLEHIDSHVDRIIARQSEIMQQPRSIEAEDGGRGLPTLQMGDLWLFGFQCGVAARSAQLGLPA